MPLSRKKGAVYAISEKRKIRDAIRNGGVL